MKDILTYGNDVEKELMNQISEETSGLSKTEKNEITRNLKNNMDFYLAKVEENLEKFPSTWGEDEAYALFGHMIASVVDTGVVKKAYKTMKKSNTWYALSK